MTAGDLVAGRYRLLHAIGQGGFSTVWEALDLKSGETRAVKLLHRQDHPQFSRRLLREAHVLLSLLHPNIVTVHDLADDPVHGPTLVMERLHGETLRQRLARVEQLPVADAVRLLRGVALGLQEAHTIGAIHRDIKPENLFLTDDGEVKLLDFGIVKLVALEGEAGSLASSLTRKGMALGTVGYMAPEQFWEDHAIDARADLWALGAVAYECLSGGLPVVASLPNQFLFRLQQQGIMPLEHAVPGLPPVLGDLVTRLLAFDREQRPASAQDVLDALALL